jgi:type II secretory pathway component PulK
LAASFLQASHSASVLAHLRTERARAQAAADAGVSMALIGVLGASRDVAWTQDGRPVTLLFGGETVRASAQDELGLIDVNAASADTLATLFGNLGSPRQESLTTARALVHWRAQHHLTDISELAGVPNAAPAVLMRAAPYLTTRTGTAAVDPVSAPGPVLASVPGVASSLVATLVSARAVASILPGTLPLLNDVTLQGVPLHHFTRIRTVCVTRSGISARREAEVELHPDAGRAYAILTWRPSFDDAE